MNAIEQIYQQLMSVFGGTNPNQFFCMLMPGTNLDPQDYAYDPSGLKPALVAEAESRLVDQMFDIAEVTGSGNGQRVSSQYLKALSVLVPKFDRVLPVVKKSLRTFLNSPVAAGTTLDGAPFAGTFQEYYFKLYGKWIAKRLAWEQKQEEVKQRLMAENPKTANEKFLEWYEGNAEGDLADIDAAMAQVLAVFSPTDMDAIMGALAAGPGGEIEEAREMVEDMRLASPSGGFTYPADLVPDNWSLNLQSDINPVDLLKDPEFIATTISARREAIMASVSQVQALLNESTTPAQMSAAAGALTNAQNAYTDAQNALLDTYTANTATAVEMYLAKKQEKKDEADKDKLDGLNNYVDKVNKSKKGNSKKGKAAKKGEAGKSDVELKPEDVKALAAGQTNLIKAQSGLLTSAQGLANAGMNLASAEAASFGELPVILSRLQAQLGELATLQSQLGDSIEASATKEPMAVKPAPMSSEALKPITDALSALTEKNTLDEVKAALSAAPLTTEGAKPWVTGTLVKALEAAKAAGATDHEQTTLAGEKTINDFLSNLGTGTLATNFKAQDILAAATEAAADLTATSSSKSDTSARYMTLQFSFTSSDMQRSSAKSSSFSQTSWGVDLFFGSGGGSSSSSSATDTQHSMDQSTAIEIGFKATKVDIERGWLDPGIFKLSGEMSRLSQVKATAGALPASADKAGNFTPFDWNANDAPATLKAMNASLFPCFPVAFVIAKDITIKFKATASSLDAMHSVMDSRSASGGGFLCFSVSKSSASHSEESSMHVQSSDTVFSITIPGPQILGWFLETPAGDDSTPLDDRAQPADAEELDILSFIAALQQVSAASKN